MRIRHLFRDEQTAIIQTDGIYPKEIQKRNAEYPAQLEEVRRGKHHQRHIHVCQQIEKDRADAAITDGLKRIMRRGHIIEDAIPMHQHYDNRRPFYCMKIEIVDTPLKNTRTQYLQLFI